VNQTPTCLERLRVVTRRLRDRRSKYLSRQDTVGFLAVALLYPLAVIDVDRTAFWMQLFYLAILL